MHKIYIDADACPVKDEAYKVARRYKLRVVVVCNSAMRTPVDVELVVKTGFGAADDWIAEQCGPGDIVLTADIPLAGRALAKGSRVLDWKGIELADADIGAALGMRDLMEHLRQAGETTRGPAPMTPRDRSRFLSKLDELVNAVRRMGA